MNFTAPCSEPESERRHQREPTATSLQVLPPTIKGKIRFTVSAVWCCSDQVDLGDGELQGTNLVHSQSDESPVLRVLGRVVLGGAQARSARARRRLRAVLLRVAGLRRDKRVGPIR